MSDLISRKDLLKALDKFIPVDPLKDDYTKGITVGIGLASGCVEKFSQWNGDSSQGLVKDLISRQDAVDALLTGKEFLMRVLDDADVVGQDREKYSWGLGLIESCINDIEELPSAEPERLTDDDFETIRIHLNAYKEKLCNQRRWKEAEEYQRIIDRFMSFASAEPRKKGKWILTQDEDYEYCTCSECGYQNGENWMNGANIPFCAMCGSYNGGEQE